MGVTDEQQFHSKSVLLWGDSFVEALQVEDHEKASILATGYLRDEGNPLEVFGIGQSGQMIADYILAMRAYEKLFTNTAEHIIFISDVRDLLPDQASQDRAQFRSLPEFKIEVDDSAQLIGSVSFVERKRLYFLSRVKTSLQKSVAKLRLGVGPVSKEYREEEAEVSVPDGTVEFLADRIRSATGKKVTILYCPEWPRFRDPMSFEDDPDYGAALELEVAFKQNGIGFENMTSDLRKTFIEDQKLTRGFSNSFPGEGHLNENGHRLVARRVVSIITKPSR
ncbi:hypothetical protein N9Z77_01810 [Akkermansiaceae bacterium]|nr:hypothetical protein [Akkermansiaceae bacterium]